jgi:hypothetical protein
MQRIGIVSVKLNDRSSGRALYPRVPDSTGTPFRYAGELVTKAEPLLALNTGEPM